MDIIVFVCTMGVILLYFDNRYVKNIDKDKYRYIYKLNYLYAILIILLVKTHENLDVYFVLFLLELVIFSNYDILYFEVEEKAFLKCIVSIIIYSFMQTESIDKTSLYNGIFMFIPLSVLYYRYKDKIGGADVKVLTLISVFMGIKVGIITLLFASLLCILYYLLNIIFIDYNIKKHSFIPFITLGLIISLFIERT